MLREIHACSAALTASAAFDLRASASATAVPTFLEVLLEGRWRKHRSRRRAPTCRSPGGRSSCARAEAAGRTIVQPGRTARQDGGTPPSARRPVGRAAPTRVAADSSVGPLVATAALDRPSPARFAALRSSRRNASCRRDSDHSALVRCWFMASSLGCAPMGLADDVDSIVSPQPGESGGISLADGSQLPVRPTLVELAQNHARLQLRRLGQGVRRYLVARGSGPARAGAHWLASGGSDPPPVSTAPRPPVSPSREDRRGLRRLVPGPPLRSGPSDGCGEVRHHPDLPRCPRRESRRRSSTFPLWSHTSAVTSHSRCARVPRDAQYHRLEIAYAARPRVGSLDQTHEVSRRSQTNGSITRNGAMPLECRNPPLGDSPSAGDCEEPELVGDIIDHGTQLSCVEHFQ